LDPESQHLQYLYFGYNSEIFSGNILIYIVLFLLIIIVNSLIYAGKTALLEISEKELRELEKSYPEKTKIINELNKRPKKFAASILICTTFLNIALIVFGDLLIKSWLGTNVNIYIGSWVNRNLFNEYFDAAATGNTLITLLSILFITFVIALFGSLLPEKHATSHKINILSLMARPLLLIDKVTFPLNEILLKLSNTTENKLVGVHNTYSTSKEDLDTAIDLAVTNQSESSVKEAGILKGIVNFGDTSAKQIMRPRMDIAGIDINADYTEVMHIVRDSGYSRLPVYKEDLDHVKGILYVKDLLCHTDEKNNFEWQKLIRNAVYFVPESKKIDELLREFQSKRMHMAIIVDEYGGTVGIATLEDIMEEVVGDIKDEFDIEEESDYIKIDGSHYIFEGKTLLNDVCRIIGEHTNIFDDVRGEADSIGGLILEITGMIPPSSQEISIDKIKLKVVSATKRRIEKVSLQIYEN
jgi:putative hemolysin